MPPSSLFSTKLKQLQNCLKSQIYSYHLEPQLQQQKASNTKNEKENKDQ
jgi:hypothetical protein